jgi:hypothetical protein
MPEGFLKKALDCGSKIIPKRNNSNMAEPSIPQY